MTREEAIEYLEIERSDYDLPVYKDSPIREALNMAIEALKEPERKKGKWLPYLEEGLKWKCSECGSRFTTPFHYCPHCGAKNGGPDK